MDEVEFLAVEPVVFCVVDFKAAVGWNAGYVSLLEL